MATHLRTILVDRVIHHAAEHALVGAPALRPTGVASTVRVFVLALFCTFAHVVRTAAVLQSCPLHTRTHTFHQSTHV